MIAVDPYIIEFVGNNWLGITLFLAGLKGVARMTKWAGDDKIYTMLSEMFGAVKNRGGKK